MNEFELVQYPSQVNQSSNANLFFAASKSQNNFSIKARPSSIYFSGQTTLGLQLGNRYQMKYLILDGNTVYERTTTAPIATFLTALSVLFCVFIIIPFSFLVFICCETKANYRKLNAKSSDFVMLQGRIGEKYELGDMTERLIDHKKEDNLRSPRKYIWEDDITFNKQSKKTEVDADIVFEDVEKMALTRNNNVKSVKVFSKKMICTVLFISVFSANVLLLTLLCNLVHLLGMVLQIMPPSSQLSTIGLYDYEPSFFLIFSIVISGLQALSIVCFLMLFLVRILKPSIGGWIFNVIYFLAVVINLLYIPLCLYLNWYKIIPEPVGGGV